MAAPEKPRTIFDTIKDTAKASNDSPLNSLISVLAIFGLSSLLKGKGK